MVHYINSLNSYTAPEFSEEQKNVLKRYFTNLDLPVYAFTSAIPTEIAGALISRFAKSNKSIRQIFWDEFIQNPDLNFNKVDDNLTNKKNDFLKNTFADFGKESAFEMTGIYIVIEQASALAIKAIESMRRMAFIEPSPNVMDFCKKENGHYLYFKDKELINLIGNEYQIFSDKLFDSYKLFQESVEIILKEKYKQENKNEQDYEGIQEEKYNILRDLLPISTRTTVCTFGYGRDWTDLVNIMISHKLEEIQELGRMIMLEMTHIIPNIIERSSGSHGQARVEYLKEKRKIINNNIQDSSLALISKRGKVENDGQITAKIRYISNNPLERLCAGIMYDKTDIPMDTLLEYYKLNPRRTADLLNQTYKIRKNRFDKVPDAFETIRLSVEFSAPWSCWKDIQRHRRLSEFHNPYFINEGFYKHPELQNTEIENTYNEIMKSTLDFIQSMKDIYPEMSENIEYLLPQGANFRWTMDMDFAEAVYIIELRNTAKGDVTYKILMRKFHEEISKSYPMLAKLIKFVL
ncbi:MAG: FAD-dependent thymidylate synthase [bacterium]